MRNEQEGPAKAYRACYCGAARKIYERGGDDDDLAAALGVTRSNLHDWEKTYEEFGRACREGKSAADDRVEESLSKLATGYDVRVEKLKAYKGRILRQEYIKIILPSAAAAQFCLTSTDRRHWKAPKDVPGHAPKCAFAEWFDNAKFETITDVIKRNEARMLDDGKEADP